MELYECRHTSEMYVPEQCQLTQLRGSPGLVSDNVTELMLPKHHIGASRHSETSFDRWKQRLVYASGSSY